MTTKTQKMTFLKRLAEGTTLIADGATGTYLQANGLEPGGDPEAMNVTDPEVVRGMATDYFEAGSDLVQTNSFGGSRFMQAKYGYGDRVVELNRLAAEHARTEAAAAEGARYVAGSMGPTGELIVPVGETPADDVYHAYVEQATALAEGGVDVLVIETMISVEEAKIAVRAAKEHTALPVAVLTTYDKGPRGYFTMMGDTPESAVKELTEAGADILGTNCGNGIDLMVELGERFRAAVDGPVWLNSNAGVPLIRQGQLIYPESPEHMAQGFKKLSDMGVEIVGGCCGTTPDHIKALVEAVRGKG
jgi:5-methyltetrahydrofolate--homocysteine methyltransferase